MSVRAIYFEEKAIGERIKKTKKQYIWKFELDGLQHTIEFLVSKLTGKKKVIQDGITLLEQKKITKSFQFPFNIGKHMLIVMYSGSLVDLRIDNHTFDSLYQGKGFNDHNVSSTAMRQAAQKPRSEQTYIAKKKVPDGWSDIKKAKDSKQYDDIPDPYAMPAKTQSTNEEHKAGKKLETLGRSQKSHTIVKKSQPTDFFGDDDFGSSNSNNKKDDDFDFDFGGKPSKNSKPDAFDFDAFGSNLPKDTSQNKGSSDWSDGLVFDSAPATNSSTANDIFGSGMLQPQQQPASTSNNPFDIFSTKPEPKPVTEPNPYVSDDVFSNNQFGGGNAFGMGFSSNANAWNSAFTPQPVFQSAFNAPIPPSKKPEQNNVFSQLNPFGAPTNSSNMGGNGAHKQPQSTGSNPLPPGVSSSDLFS